MIPKLKKRDASLLQRGLASLGLYKGTFKGVPGPITEAAYVKYLKSIGENGDRSFSQKIVEIARGEVGVEEVNGTNSGKRVEEYQASTSLGGTGWPWCAAFVCWVYDQAMHGNTAPASTRPSTAAAFGFEQWARDNGVALVKPFSDIDSINAGDIIVYKFSHVGIAAAPSSGGYVKTIEGNTDGRGSREGGGVFRKTRKFSSIRSVIRMS